MSSKVFGKVLSFVGLAIIGVVTAGVGLAAAGVIGAGLSIGAVLAETAFLGITVGQFLALGVLSVTIGGSLSKGRPEIDPVSEIAGRLNISTDPVAPRTVVIGEAATAGVLRYREVRKQGEGEPDVMWVVLALAGYPVDSMTGFRFNGEDVTVNPDGSVGGKFAGKLFVYFRNGTETTQAFPQVGGKWGAKSRVGRGIPSAAVKMIADEVFEGRFEPVFTLKGAKLYDPRKDSTVGGSGAHRFADSGTFEWSANAALPALNYLRGFWINDYRGTPVLIAGRGLKDKPARFDFPVWIDAANVCDENVAVKAGGSIPRYRADGILDPRRSHKDILKLLDTSHGGATFPVGNKYRCYPAAWRPATEQLNQTHIIGVPRRIDLRGSRKDKVNVVRGGFADKDNNFELRDYPAVKNTASIARIGEQDEQLDFPFVTDHRQAQRLAKIAMNLANAQRKFQALYKVRALALAPGGEAVEQTYAPYNVTAETFRITEWEVSPAQDNQGHPRLSVGMTLVEDMASFYAWSAAADEQDLAVPDSLPAAGAVPTLGQIQGGGLRDPVRQDQGGTLRKIGIGIAEGEANDGDAFEFSQPWDAPPIVDFKLGGKAGVSSLAEDQEYDVRAVNVTTSGFEVVAKIKAEGTGGTPGTTQTDTTESTPDPDTVDEQIDKGIAAEADNDTYTFKLQVTVEQTIQGEDGFIEIEFYTFKNGVGWTLRATATYSASGIYTKNITADGLNSTSDKFGVKVKNSKGIGTQLDDFIEVKYVHGAEPGTEGGEVSATPPAITFELKGGIEAGVALDDNSVDISVAAETMALEEGVLGINPGLAALVEEVMALDEGALTIDHSVTVNLTGETMALEEAALIVDTPVLIPVEELALEEGQLTIQTAAFPKRQGTATSTNADTTSHTVNLPAGIQSGELLFIHFRTQAGTINTPAGWTKIEDNETFFKIFKRVADGTEGSTVTVTTSVNRDSVVLAERWSNASGNVELASAAGNDPPNLAPTWGTKKTAWETVFTYNGASASTAPANYGSQADAGPQGGVDRRTSSALRELEASSENPGAWSAAANDFRAVTIAIEPT